MNQKNIATILLLIASAIGGPVAVDHVVNAPVPVVVFDGPDAAQVGELIELSFSASNVTWKLPIDDYRSLDADTIVVSFREPGTYQIIVAGRVGNSTVIEVKVIRVDGEIPTPIPDPVPDAPPVVVVESSLASDVFKWCQDTDAPRDVCLQLAANFEAAAADSKSISALLAKTAELNRSVDQADVSSVMGNIQSALISEFSGQDLDAHVQAWRAIASGLRKWASA